MSFTSSKIIYFIPLIAFLSACRPQAADPLPTDEDEALVTTDSVVVIDNFPKDGAKEIPVESPVIVKFTGQINAGRLDGFNFRVEDEEEMPVDGEFEINADQTELKFWPTVNRQRSVFRRATRYHAYVEFLRDPNNQLIAPYDWVFRTVDVGSLTGRLKVLAVYPDKSSIGPRDPIEFQFSEEISPRMNVCNLSGWKSAFQFLDFQLFDEVGTFNGQTPDVNICLVCSPSNGKCDRIRARPVTSWPTGSIMHIQINPTFNLKGVSSGDGLTKAFTSKIFIGY